MEWVCSFQCDEASAPEHRWEALTAGAHFSEGAVPGGVPLPGDQRRRAQPRRGTGRHRRLQGRRGQGVSGGDISRMLAFTVAS